MKPKIRTAITQERRVSLQDTMNQMARRMDELLVDDQNHNHNPFCAGKDVSEELRFWLAIDPILSELHKHLANARSNKANIEARHGTDDPITDVACDMVDSAQSSLDTRLIELRRDEEAKALLKAMIIKAHDEKEAAIVETIRLRSKRFWQDLAVPRYVKPADQQAADSFWMVLASMIVLRHNLQQANKILSAVVAFSKASANDDFVMNHPIASSV